MDNFSMYHQLQYDRIDKLESRRESFSNLVLTLNVGILTFGFLKEYNVEEIIQNLLLLLIIVINTIAYSFIRQSIIFIENHQNRARLALSLYDPVLDSISVRFREKQSKFRLFRRNNLYIYLHLFFGLVAFCLLYRQGLLEFVLHYSCEIFNSFKYYLIFKNDKMLESIVLGVLGSIIASLIIFGGQYLIRRKRCEKLFKPWEGTYKHYQLDGTLIQGTSTQFTFEHPNILNIFTIASNDTDTYKGKIFMNESNPEAGSGVYDYFKRTSPEWGTRYSYESTPRFLGKRRRLFLSNVLQ